MLCTLFAKHGHLHGFYHTIHLVGRYLHAGGCTIAGTFPMLYLINADVAAVVPLTVIFAILAGGLSGTVGPNMR